MPINSLNWALFIVNLPYGWIVNATHIW